MDYAFLENFIEKIISYINSLENINDKENNLGRIDGEIIGNGYTDYTQDAHLYNFDIDNKKVVLMDLPGIEGNEKKYFKIINKNLLYAHCIFYVKRDGKKTEQGTLDRIKNYMKDGTSLYLVQNVVKNGKLPIDKCDTYSECLAKEYDKIKKAINQTENELKPIFNDSFKCSVSVNGLLSFCSLALMENGETTIDINKDEQIKFQKKFLQEYSNDRSKMFFDSQLYTIDEIIKEKANNFENEVYNENMNKLKTRIGVMYDKLIDFKKIETEKLKSYENSCDTFKNKVLRAKNRYIEKIDGLGNDVASDVFRPIRTELNNKIEVSKGKIKKEELSEFFNKDKLANGIESIFNEKIKKVQIDYKNEIEDAYQKFQKENNNIESLYNQMMLSENIINNRDFNIDLNINNINDKIEKILELGLEGLGLSTLLPTVGPIAVAVIGAISLLINFFSSEKDRVKKLKNRVSESIDKNEKVVENIINNVISEKEYKEKIEEYSSSLIENIETQKKSLIEMSQMLILLSKNLQKQYKSIDFD